MALADCLKKIKIPADERVDIARAIKAAGGDETAGVEAYMDGLLADIEDARAQLVEQGYEVALPEVAQDAVEVKPEPQVVEEPEPTPAAAEVEPVAEVKDENPVEKAPAKKTADEKPAKKPRKPRRPKEPKLSKPKFQRPITHFFSPLYRGIEGAKQKRAQAKDWKAIIRKMPGVKAVEIDWMGVDEWLDMQEGQVSKEDLMSFVRDSQIELVESRLEGDEPAYNMAVDWDHNNPIDPDWDYEREAYLDEAREQLESEYFEENREEPDTDIPDDEVADRAEEIARDRFEPTEFAADVYDRDSGGYFQTGSYDTQEQTYTFPDLDVFQGSEQDVIEAAEEARNDTVDSDVIDGPTQFEEYTEPGGENYREVLLRVPGLHREGKNKVPEGTSQWDPARKEPFVQPAHFEQENIVVHARVKDRTGANGEKILFVEEIQSDLASKHREATESPEVTARRNELRAEHDRLSQQITDIDNEIRAEIRDDFDASQMTLNTATRRAVEGDGGNRSVSGMAALAIMNSPKALDLAHQRVRVLDQRKVIDDERIALGTEKTLDPSLPDTPFKEEATYQLMTKHLLRMAAEGGYDQLAWTPGYMQAERWDNAAQSVVEGVSWQHRTETEGEKVVDVDLAMAQGGGTINLIADRTSGEILYAGHQVFDGKNLRDAVGPSVAKDMLAEPSGNIPGAKITFPDSGYAIAYDQQTRKAVDKFARKYGGKVTVDETLPDFETHDFYDRVLDKIPSDEIIPRLMDTGAINQTSVENAKKQRRSDVADPQDVLFSAFTTGRNNMAEIAAAFPEVPFSNPVWSVTITDKMREAAMQPMPILQQGKGKKVDHAKIKAMMPELRKKLDKMGLNRVKLVQTTPDQDFQGVFGTDDDGVMTIVIGAALDPENTLRHEAVHALKAMDLFTAKEWDALVKEAESVWMRKYEIARRYGEFSREIQIEEAIAEAFGAYEGRAPNNLIQAAFAKMKRFFKALRGVLSDQGITSINDIFADVAEGRVGRRDSGGQVAPIAAEQTNTSTKAFKEWFGSSKVVDENGEPLVVYHGTTDDFTDFQDHPDFAQGFYFTPDPDVAAVFAETGLISKGLEGARTIPVYLAIENPADLRDGEAATKVYRALKAANEDEAAKSVLTTRDENMWELFHDGNRDVLEALERTGYDGLLLTEPDFDAPSYVAFSPTQIKSVYNRGSFDPSDPRILYQRHPANSYLPQRHVHANLQQANQSRFARLKSGTADLFERGRINLQDRYLPILRAVQSVEKQIGQKIPDWMNPYRTEEQMAGKVGRDLDDVEELYMQPVIDLLAETKGDLTTENVGHWLNARHAKERNAHISSINPNYNPGEGSGFTDAEAQKVLNEFANGPHQDTLDKIGRIVDDLREFTIQIKQDSGLLSKADADALRNMYQFYVPLRGFAETDHADATLDVNGIGRRLNVKGRESKRALGRKSLAFNPLVGAFTQAQEAAIRAGKNRVGNALYELVQANPSSEWSIQKVKQRRYYNSANGMVVTQAVSAESTQLEDNEFATKVDGQEYRIKLEDPRLARAVGNVGSQQFGIIVRSLMGFSRYFSATNTMLNPEFMITNALRDFTTAQVNIQGFGKAEKAKLAKAMAKNWRKAFAGAWRGMGDTKDPHPWAKKFREYEEAGGKVSFWQIDDPNKASLDLEKRVKRASSMTGKARSTLLFDTHLNPVLRQIERVNLAVDNAIRLAAFSEAKGLGWSDQDAASLAKNLTVNFNRRGEMTPVLNGLYPFFNAAMQGTHILLTALKYKRPRRIVAALFAYGILEDMVNSWLSDEDDDGELAWDKVPDWKLRRNILINADGEDPWSIPLPYGYNVFPYAGKQFSKVARGVKDPGEAMAHMLAATLESISPISGQGIGEAFMPTILKPGAEIAMNRDFFLGRPISPRKWSNDEGLPDAYNAYRSTPEFWKEISDIMNRATGGNTLEPGMIDVSPDTLEHLFGFGTGGAGRFAGRIYNLGEKMALGDVNGIELNDIPFARQLKIKTGDWLDRSRYYDFTRDVDEALNREKVSKQTGDEMTDEDLLLVKLKPISKTTKKRLKKLRTIKYAVYDGDMPRAERNAKLDDIREKELKLFLEFNRQYLALMGPQGE